MPQSHECDYCGAEIEPGTGTMFVRTNGSTIYYCSAKCEKNADLGREARELNWTEAGREQTGSEAAESEPVSEADEETETAPDLEAAEAEADEESSDEDEDQAEEAEA